MAGEAFQHAKARAVFADHRRSLVGQDLLVAVRLEELADPEAARVAASLPGRERVVGADHLITIGDIGASAQEQRAIARHVLQEPVVAVGHHLDVLGRDEIRLRQHLLIGIADNHLAVILP